MEEMTDGPHGACGEQREETREAAYSPQVTDTDAIDVPEYAHLLEDIREIVDAFRNFYDEAYEAFLPQVEDICTRDASRDDVEHLLDLLLDFAGEDRMLLLFKRVCRAYLYRYPESIVDYIHFWRDIYDEDHLEGDENA